MTKAEPTPIPPPAPPGRSNPSAPVTQPDLRESARARLLIRSAKLICASGEYVCLVRDVSSSGVRLRLFHALPPETEFALEMDNGEVKSMACKWCKDEHAGFQFAEPIDASAFIEDSDDHPRRPLRLRLECHGQVFSQGRSTPIVLRNISQGGAQIEATTWLALHQTVRLAVRGMPERFAQVRWRDRHNHGLAFTHAFRLDELAAYATALQPFSQPSLAAGDSPRDILTKADV